MNNKKREGQERTEHMGDIRKYKNMQKKETGRGGSNDGAIQMKKGAIMTSRAKRFLPKLHELLRLYLTLRLF